MSSSTPLSSFRIRPRLRDILSGRRDEVMAHLKTALRAEPEGTFELRPFDEFLGIHISEKDRRYWSPRLILSLYDQPDGVTLVEGTYGPEIEVWSVFLYGYLSTGLLGTLSAIYGGAQVFIGEEHPWAFYVTGTMAVMALVLYLAAQLGQKFAAHQTYRLHEAYERAAGPLRAPVAR